MVDKAGNRASPRRAEPARIEVELPALASTVGAMRHRASDFAAAHGADRTLQADVALAISEAATNAVKYAYHGEEVAGKVLLSASAGKGCLEFTISDKGNGFQEGQSGGLGLGLQLIAELSSDVKVVEGPTGTRVQMRFILR
jgi:serine/threonine-protein kinase RsbW